MIGRLMTVVCLASISIASMIVDGRSVCAQTDTDTDRPHLAVAFEIANWLDALAVREGNRVSWPINDELNAATVHHLYSGTAGVVIFYLEMYLATDESRFLDQAIGGAETLIAELDRVDADSQAGLWVGYSGFGYVLGEVYRVTGEDRFLDAATQAVDLLQRHGHHVEGNAAARVSWNDVTDIISGTAGVGMFLLYADEELEHPDAMPMAIAAGDQLIDDAKIILIPDRTQPESQKRALLWEISRSNDREMPNYSHGTAGVIDFLAALVQRLESSDRSIISARFRAAATGGFDYLLSLGHHTPDRFSVFHHRGDGEELYYLGWCHGPCGTLRACERVDAMSGGSDSPLANGVEVLLSSGIPAERPDGFWNNVGLCCGSAGVVAFLAEIAASPDLTEQGKQRATELADRLIDDVLDRATDVELPDGRTGLKWIQAEHRVRPDLLQAQTGLMQGAAGIGLMFLQLDAIDQRREFQRTLPMSIR